MRIIKLEAENVKRLRAVEIVPESDVIVVGGRNAQGKSSCLDAIEMALGGGSTFPPEPIRRGERQARIVVNLGDIVIERTFSARGSRLEVRNAEGVPQKSPQALLDALCSKVAFDPFAFSRLAPKEQDKILREVVGLDLTDLETERARVYAERTDANRAVKELEARLVGKVEYPEAPAKEVSVAEIAAELKKANAHNEAVRRAEDAVTAAKGELSDAVAEVARLEAELAEAREEVARAQTALNDLPPVPARVDVAPIEARLETAEETNRQVRENIERAALLADVKSEETLARSLDDRIQAIDAEKAERLAKAPFPVPGLGFNDLGPTLNGIPLEQASQAERLRVSIAIGLALHPKLRVLLVRDGSLLDNESLALLTEMAREHDAQVWLEKVSNDGAGCSLVIEDGAVRESAAAE